MNRVQDDWITDRTFRWIVFRWNDASPDGAPDGGLEQRDASLDADWMRIGCGFGTESGFGQQLLNKSSEAVECFEYLAR